MMRRELQDATALQTIVSCYESLLRGERDPFAIDVLDTLTRGWESKTLDDRIRVSQDEQIARRAQELGLFTWGRGNRHRNRLPQTP